MKRIFIALAATAMLLGMCACGERKIDEDVLTVNSFEMTEKTIKPLGRTEFKDGTLWLAYSGAGAEFTFNGTKCSVTFSGDDTILNEDFNSLPRVAVFVDGERVLDKILSDAEKTFTVFESETAGDHTVRIVKLSETGNSTCAVKSVEVEAYGAIKPTEKKERAIEFVGDSITCGYGVDAENQNEGFTTRTEDCTKAYAYLTAELLDADYSLVSKSGHGIISGYSGDGTKQAWGVMPEYYERFGSGGGSYKGTSPDSVSWDFKKHKNDVVVINLGTNDSSYTRGDPSKCDEYKDGYVEFLKTVRKLNPDATIICALGIMGDELYPTIEEVIKEYKSSEDDDKVVSFRFTPHNGSDGYGADWHPSAATHKKAAEKLAEFIKDQMAW